MKKLLILLTTMLFGITAGFAQVDIVNVTWDAEDCFEGTCGAQALDYFKITISIYDDANTQWVIQNKTVTETDMNATDIDVYIPEVDNYCNKTFIYTPSFTIYATVTLMDTSTSPATECCSGNDDYSSYSCHDFYDDVIELTPAIVLN
jgi:hypothetical protein